VEVRRVALSGGGWIVTSADGAERRYDRLVSTIPLPTMIQSLRPEAPREVAEAARRLKSNSIAICMFRVRGDRLGDNLAVQVADRSILFHRITKLNYLLPAEADDGTASLMAEVTYRRGSPLGGMSNDDLLDRLEDDMVRAGFISGREAVLERGVRRAEHAYVIYDLDHRRNMSIVRGYCEEQLGLWLHGRFGEFVYANMDACIARSFEKHRVIKGSL
jgi:protoporphyrinogen oxidase